MEMKTSVSNKLKDGAQFSGVYNSWITFEGFDDNRLILNIEGNNQYTEIEALQTATRLIIRQLEDIKKELSKIQNIIGKHVLIFDQRV